MDETIAFLVLLTIVLILIGGLVGVVLIVRAEYREANRYRRLRVNEIDSSELARALKLSEEKENKKESVRV